MRFVLFTSLVVIVVIASACGPNQRILQSANETQAANDVPKGVNVAPAPLPSFQQDLDAMRTADFKFIYVFRRKDHGPLDADDKKFIAGTVPPEMNRRRLSDEGKAVIIGSNFRMSPANLEPLINRFAFEDHSQESLTVTNSNR